MSVPIFSLDLEIYLKDQCLLFYFLTFLNIPWKSVSKDVLKQSVKYLLFTEQYFCVYGILCLPQVHTYSELLFGKVDLQGKTE
jgi:hypothetical protein